MEHSEDSHHQVEKIWHGSDHQEVVVHQIYEKTRRKLVKEASKSNIKGAVLAVYYM